jgi:uncharacterized protein YkvS
MKAWQLCFLVSALAVASNQASAQIAGTAAGIIVYDPSGLGVDFTLAKHYRSVQTFGQTTTVNFSDGTKSVVKNSLIRNLISYPAESASSKEISTVADLVKELASTYPQSSAFLSQQESLLREAERKALLVEAQRLHQAKQVGRVVSFNDNAGKVYSNVKIEVIEPDGITIAGEGGRQKIEFINLPKEIQAFLGYDPQIAADYIVAVQKREADQKRLEAAQLAENARREAVRIEQERMKAANAAAEELRLMEMKRSRPIIEIESDLSGFVDKIVTIEGVVSIDSYYNYEYDELRDSHYCFSVRDKNFDQAHVYALKSSEVGMALREELLKAGGQLRGKVSFMIAASRLGDNQTSILADLVAYAPPSE